MKVCRGIRGAITVEDNTREAILSATHDLLAATIEVNGIDPEDVASVVFTTTTDLTAEYPAIAARALGWTDTPLLCSHEMNVPSGLSKCVRILIHWNTEKSAHEVTHVYLKEARDLRPDRAEALAMMSLRRTDEGQDHQ